MKKTIKQIILVATLSLAFSATPLIIPSQPTAITVEAATSVKYTLEDGVLTVYGKGNMPKNMNFKNNLKIKKVIIKKGVTSICKNAFRNCSNLKEVKIAKTVKTIGKYSFEGTGIKTLKIPNSVKKIGYNAFNNCHNLETVKMPGDFTLTDTPYENYESFMKVAKTIKFTTPLNIHILGLTPGENWIVSKEDPNYTSIDGVIYSKDGSMLVRVPSEREELTLADSCTTFCVNSLLYSTNIKDKEYDTHTLCKLKKLILPKTVTKVDTTSYASIYAASVNDLILREITVKNPNLDTTSITNLFYLVYDMSEEIEDVHTDKDLNALEILKFEDGVITTDGDYIIAHGNTLISYTGNDENIVIPNYVTAIGDYAFYYCNADNPIDVEYKHVSTTRRYSKLIATSITFPEGLKSIGNYAFYNAKIANSIVLPESLKNIGDYAFSKCGTNGITLPTKLESIGKYAFASFIGFNDTVTLNANIKFGKNIFDSSDITSINLPASTTVIPKGMFRSCNITTLGNLPKLKRIKKEAFAHSDINVQEILNIKTLQSIDALAFYQTNFNNITIPSHIKEIGVLALVPRRSFLTDKNKWHVIIEGSATKFNQSAFGHNNKVVLNYTTTGNSMAFADVSAYRNNNEKNTSIHLDINKIENIDGYEVAVYTNSKCTKNKKTYTIKASKKGMTSKILSYKPNSKKVYVKVRTYKTKKGKKIYGKWTKIKAKVW